MSKRRVKRHAVNQPLDPSYRLIPLTQGQNAIVDAEDYDWLNQWNWCACWSRFTKTYYPTRYNDGKTFCIHQAIIPCIDGEQVDHIDKNTLNNRRSNLRKCTPSQNAQNRTKYRNNKSGFKGVSWDSREEKWTAQILENGKNKRLGYFHNPEDAAKAYDKYAKILHGEFAVLNLPTPAI